MFVHCRSFVVLPLDPCKSRLNLGLAGMSSINSEPNCLDLTGLFFFFLQWGFVFISDKLILDLVMFLCENDKFESVIDKYLFYELKDLISSMYLSMW